MVAAGHETPVSLIVNAVRELLAKPERLSQVPDGDLTWNAVALAVCGRVSTRAYRGIWGFGWPMIHHRGGWLMSKVVAVL